MGWNSSFGMEARKNNPEGSGYVVLLVSWLAKSVTKNETK